MLSNGANGLACSGDMIIIHTHSHTRSSCAHALCFITYMYTYITHFRACTYIFTLTIYFYSRTHSHFSHTHIIVPFPLNFIFHALTVHPFTDLMQQGAIPTTAAQISKPIDVFLNLW